MAKKAGNAAAGVVADDVDDDIWEPDYSQMAGASTLTDPQAIFATFQQESPEVVLPSGYIAHPCVQAAVRDTNAGEMRATFTVVTRPKKNEPNRAGRMIQIAPGPNGGGIGLEAYQANPIVLFNHGFDGFAFPLGLSEDRNGKSSLKVTKGALTSDVYFSQASPLAEDVFRMVQAGILRAASIGINPAKVICMRWDDNSQLPPGVENYNRYGCDVVESEMMEWSIVAVGADAGALRQCLETGKIGGKPYRPVLTPIIRQWAEKPQAWAPGFGGGTVAPSVRQGEGFSSPTAITLDQFKSAISELGTSISQTIQQGFEAVNANLVSPNSISRIAPVTHVATQTGQANVPTATAPPVTPAVTLQQFQSGFQQQLSAVVSEAVRDAVAPVAAAQNGITTRLDQMTGKLP